MSREKRMGKMDVQDGSRTSDLEPEPVIAESTGRDRWERTNALLSMVIFILVPLPFLWLAVEALRSGESPLWLLLFIPLIALLGLAGAIIIVNTRVELLERGIHVDGDRLRVMGEGGVVREFPFDGRTEVGVDYFDAGPYSSGSDVVGYRFKRGWWVVSFVSHHYYPREVILQMWPVLKVAVRKHGMRTGKTMKMLMESEDE